MLSLPDIKEKQILFIQTERGCRNYIRFSNENVIFEKNGEVINRASCHRVFAIFIIGDFSVSNRLIEESIKYGISLFLLRNNFEVYATILSHADGHYLLREKQYTSTEDKNFLISKHIVRNKIENYIQLLALKDKNFNPTHLKNLLYSIEKTKNTQQLLGVEGNAAKYYFKEYFADTGWTRRMPRVKPDITNYLMDIGYTFLFNFTDCLLRLHGFDTYKGVYHRLFFQRRSLSCDLIEPFRCIIDRKILKSFHLKQIKESDFKFINGSYSLSFEKSKYYSNFFLQTIMDHREELYSYVHEFYRHIMHEENQLPTFKV